jgi:hypothetical protein
MFVLVIVLKHSFLAFQYFLCGSACVGSINYSHWDFSRIFQCFEPEMSGYHYKWVVAGPEHTLPRMRLSKNYVTSKKVKTFQIFILFLRVDIRFRLKTLKNSGKIPMGIVDTTNTSYSTQKVLNCK